MALKFAPVQKHPDEMTAEELRDLLADMPDTQVMRTLLMAEINAIHEGATRERRTMRNMWYDLVKPALSRAGILNNVTKGGKPVPWPDKLSSVLTELVREGSTSYEELLIVDGSRQRQMATVITSTIADVQLVGDHFPWVILFTEKDTIWNDVQNLASLYGVSAISGGGQPSFACTENMVRGIVRHESFRKQRPDKLIVLTLTDYDPSGYTIAKAQFEQIVDAVGALSEQEHGALQNVVHQRLGLYPWQITPEQRQIKAYEPKDVGFEEWYAKTGGVDGERLGLELDALPLSTLRSMFADGIEQHVDMDRRRQDLREAYVDILACQLIRPEFDARRRALGAAVKASGAWDAIEATDIPAALFRQAAIQGWDSINPVEDIRPFDCHDDVRAIMTETLQKFGLVQN